MALSDLGGLPTASASGATIKFIPLAGFASPACLGENDMLPIIPIIKAEAIWTDKFM